MATCFYTRIVSDKTGLVGAEPTDTFRLQNKRHKKGGVLEWT